MLAELQKLKAMRPEISRLIETARGHGDLSENGDYDAAKQKSGMVEAKIRDLEVKLANLEVIDPRSLGAPVKVFFGMTVEVEDVESGEKKKVSIFGPDESNVACGWISIESPLGRGLIGKTEGDIARVQLPGGVREYEVLSISVEYDDLAETAQQAE